ncbi:MAG: hypothetical protein J7D61_07770 [Marichromatium sp.]|nr:hypothetical protein [Marichromatium sp.]
MSISAQCPNCLFYEEDGTCRAYPEGIPGDILGGARSHRTPQPDQAVPAVRYIPATHAGFEALDPSEEEDDTPPPEWQDEQALAAERVAESPKVHRA